MTKQSAFSKFRCNECGQPIPTDDQRARKKARQARYVAKVRALLAEARKTARSAGNRPS